MCARCEASACGRDGSSGLSETAVGPSVTAADCRHCMEAEPGLWVPTSCWRACVPLSFWRLRGCVAAAAAAHPAQIALRNLHYPTSQPGLPLVGGAAYFH